MIIFDNNEIERELIVPKGLNLWHFLYVKTYLCVRVVWNGDNGVNRYNT